ncbi:hypothetical protein ISF6_1145 [Piscinibacter sakaiensis]|uniref:Uncharacterized protein n=1 Tax=Piscinibacter sakaiensis TaxID=1547922 RepID=A0A0K8NYK0_PISS1|nr:hypothetical protein ISF6_1145 [Piscinibacter sakaiensis]
MGTRRGPTSRLDLSRAAEDPKPGPGPGPRGPAGARVRVRPPGRPRRAGRARGPAGPATAQDSSKAASGRPCWHRGLRGLSFRTPFHCGVPR